MSRDIAGRLARLAAERYPKDDRFAVHFARGKLAGDPVYAYLLRRGLIPDGARLLDIGCGQGLLGALLLAAQSVAATEWPGDWARAPARVIYRGIEISPRDAARARVALGPGAQIQQHDVGAVTLPSCDVVLLLDVLHYLDSQSQDAVLRGIREALADGGVLLMRVADANGSLRFRVTDLLDRIAMGLRGRWYPRLHSRPIAAWRRDLEARGFQVEATPMSEGTPFANVLLVARYDPSRSARNIPH